MTMSSVILLSLLLMASPWGTLAELSEDDYSSQDATAECPAIDEIWSIVKTTMIEFRQTLEQQRIQHDVEIRELESKLKIIESNPLAFDNPIAFTASLSSTFTGGGNDAIVPYDRVYLNHGEHYSTTDYHFTAPVRGLYWFSISEYGEHYALVTLLVNGDITVTGGNDVSSENYGDNVSAILMLEAGDRVAVIKQINTSVLHESGGRNGNVFSGFLYAQL